MDSNWRQWRHYETLWEEFGSKGWELGPLRYLNLPPVMAEFGPYRIVFRYHDPDTDESLFEVRQMLGGEEHRVVLVWNVPTTEEAEGLLDRYGVSPDELPVESATGDADLVHTELWGSLLPPVVYANDPGAYEKR